jgi:hypothetical protein
VGNDQREARIIDLDSEDGEVGPGALSIPGPSRAQLLIGFVVVAAAVAVAFGPLGTGHGSAGKSSAPTTGPQRATYAPAPTESPALGGWPVSVDPQYNQTVSVGPDGTVYVGHQPGLDASGRPRSGWLALPDGTVAEPCAYGSDGTIYGFTLAHDGTTNIWIFGPDGKLRIQEPINVGGYSSVVPGPGGSAYFVEPQGGDAGESTIQIVEPYGSGPAIVTPGWVASVMVGEDGTMYLEIQTPFDSSQYFPGYALRVLSPDGAQVGPDGAQVWRGMALAPDGTLYAWGFDIAGDGQVVATSQLAAFDSSGRSKPGWPVAFSGPISVPQFSPDGTVYLINGYSTLVALGPDGRTRAGWPVMLPAGETAMVEASNLAAPGAAQSPVVDDSGKLVFVTVSDLQGPGTVMAFDTGGDLAWSLVLVENPTGIVEPQLTLGAIFVRLNSGEGRIYVILENEIAAIAENGDPVPGWPLLAPASFAGWLGLWPAPDGGLVVSVGQASGIGSYLAQIYRVGPNNMTAR